MTLNELNNHMKNRLQRDKALELLKQLNAVAVASPTFDGMPHGSEIKDKVGDLAIEINDIERRIQYFDDLIEAESKEINVFINSLSDDYVKLIFRLRFIRCLSWSDVANILGENASENSIKKICYKQFE